MCIDRHMCSACVLYAHQFLVCSLYGGACRHQNPLDPNAPDMTQFKTVEEWLCSIKMARYHESFQRSGFTTMEAVSRLTLKDLAALGVVLVGHQKKIMNSVQTLRAQINATMSDGCVV